MITARYIQIGLVGGAVVIGGWLLVSSTGASLGTLLLIGLFLLCPLMMLGMHGGGHKHGVDESKPSNQENQAPTRPHSR